LVTSCICSSVMVVGGGGGGGGGGCGGGDSGLLWGCIRPTQLTQGRSTAKNFLVYTAFQDGWAELHLGLGLMRKEESQRAEPLKRSKLCLAV
jgi:hypothetical protein